MAAKPSTVPLWNTGGLGTDGEANNVAPSAGKIIIGWDRDEKPVADYFNDRMGLTGDWCQYLSDGALTGNHSITGTFLASGATTLQSTLGVTGLITATAGVTCAANQHITQSGTGEYKHGDKVKVVGPWSLGYDASWTRIANGIQSGGAGSEAYGSAEFLVGDRVKSLEISTKGNPGETGDFSISVWKITAAGVVTLINTGGIAHSIPNQTNVWATASVDLVDTTIASGDTISIQVTANEAGQVVGNMRWTFDHP